MFSPDPDSGVVDAWLSGELPPEKAKELEAYFESETPTALFENDDELEPEVIAQLASLQSDKTLAELVARVKSGLSCEAFAPKEDSWREVLEPSEEPGLLGTLGIYQVTEVIATGGMGIILKGWDPELRRFAALKILSPDLASTASARERFLREARSGARLDQECILPIYGVFDDSIPWFAMQFVEGGTLRDRLDRDTPLTFDELKSYALGIASALEAAHAGGVLHRDIKPGNILVSEGGDRLWVCDFGIARSAEDPSLTYAGAIAGTPQFMSPEQAAGKPLDQRSDLFSLGSVLYLCATGEHLVSGDTSSAVINELCSKDFSVDSSKLEHLPKWFRHLLARLLAQNPDNRPGSARTVIEAIEAEFSSPPQRVSRRRRYWLPIFVTVAIALLATLAILPRGATSDTAATTFPLAGDHGVIINPSTGSEYDSLAVAVEEAPEGGTLHLRGTTYIHEEIVIDKSLRIEPVPGEAATIIVLCPLTTHGIFAFTGIEIRRIRIIRPYSKQDSMPHLGIKSGENTSLIEDCEFIGGRTDTHGEFLGTAVSITNSRAATIRRCVFRSSYGVYLATDDGELASSSVAIEECIFTGIGAIALRSWGEAREIEFQVSRSLFMTDHAITRQRLHTPLPFAQATINNSVFDCRDSILTMPDVDLERLNGRLRWEGDGNTYRPGTKWLTALKGEDELVVESFAEFEKILPAISDKDSAIDSKAAAQFLDELNFPRFHPAEETIRELRERKE